MTTKKKATSKPKLQTGVSAGADVVKAAKPEPVKFVRRDVVGCSACGQDHTRVLFRLRDGWATMEYPYSAKCPVSGKGILMKVGD